MTEQIVNRCKADIRILFPSRNLEELAIDMDYRNVRVLCKDCQMPDRNNCCARFRLNVIEAISTMIMDNLEMKINDGQPLSLL